MFKRLTNFFLFSSLLIFISCFNNTNPFIFQEETTSETPASTPARDNPDSSDLIWITATGSYTTDSDFSSTAGGRAAFPDNPEDITGTYYVVATSGTLTSNGTVNTTDHTFSVPLAVDYSWTIEIGIKDSDNIMMFAKTTDVITPNASNPFITISGDPLVIKPYQTASIKGKIELNIEIESGVDANGLEIWLDGTQMTNEAESADALTKILLTNLTPKAYSAEIILKKGDYPIFSETQTINVYSNLTTKRWTSNGSSAIVSDGGTGYKFLITQALIDQCKQKFLYVGSTNVGGVTFDAKTPSEGGKGTLTEPYANINDALNKIKAIGDGSDYKILISGLTQPPENSDFYLGSDFDGKASEITFCGTSNGTGLNETDVIQGTISTLFCIQTNAKIIFRNIKITGATGTAIIMYSTGTGVVSLQSGAYITGITGGKKAVYKEGGTLEMSGTAYIAPDNFIQLVNNQYIKVTGDLSLPSGVAATEKNAIITPSSWVRGTTQVLTADTIPLITDNADRFGLSDEDFFIFQKGTTTPLGVIDAPFWVSNTRIVTDGSSPSDDTGHNGTRKKPYSSIVYAAQHTWNTESTIYVNGTITASNSNTLASIPSSGVASTKINLIGQNSGKINAAGYGSALTINKQVEVTIQDLEITGGNAASGGGINIATSGAVVNLESGAKVTGNKATSNSGKGAGVYVSNGTTLNIKTGAEISGNTPYSTYTITGGGVYNEGTVNMSGGSLGTTGSPNTANIGGALYNKGTLNLSSTVSIPAGTTPTEMSNDIALYYDSTNNVYKSITVDSTFSTSTNIAITPEGWHRGKQVVTAYNSYFKITDPAFSILSSTGNVGKIDAPIYVVGSSSVTVSDTTYGAGKTITNGGRGSKSNPYSTISEAVAQCWTGTSYSRNEVNVVGTVYGAQQIPDTFTTGYVSSLSLKGVSNSSATLSAKPSASGTASSSTLTISSKVPITINNLKITDGNATNGGGITIPAGGQLTLSTGAVVSGNYASGNGGGIYLSGKDSNNVPAKLFVQGGAVIGDSEKTSYNTIADSSNKSNYAGSFGGGIYAGSGAEVTITQGHICYNYAVNRGGGIAAENSTVNITATNKANAIIKCNQAGYYGGAIYVNREYSNTNTYNASLSFTGGTVQYCKASNGSIFVSGFAAQIDSKAYIPYSTSNDTKNYIYLGYSTYSGNVVWKGTINSTTAFSSSHTPSDQAHVYIQGADYNTSISVLNNNSPNYDKFKIQNNLGNPGTAEYGSQEIKSNGNYQKYRGTKVPTSSKAVGDIFFNDGSMTPYTSNLLLSNAQKSAAIAVLFYVDGTGLNNGSDTTTKRTLGVGMVWQAEGDRDIAAWCLSSASKVDATISSIECTVSGNKGNYTISGRKNGKDNYSQIDTTANYSKYPAFNWCYTYSSHDGTGVSGTSYSTGWYLPSIAELYAMWPNKAKINGALQACNHTALAESVVDEDDIGWHRAYWASTPSSNTGARTFDFWDCDINGYSRWSDSDAFGGHCILAIREF